MNFKDIYKVYNDNIKGKKEALDEVLNGNKNIRYPFKYSKRYLYAAILLFFISVSVFAFYKINLGENLAKTYISSRNTDYLESKNARLSPAIPNDNGIYKSVQGRISSVKTLETGKKLITMEGENENISFYICDTTIITDKNGNVISGDTLKKSLVITAKVSQDDAHKLSGQNIAYFIRIEK